MSREAVLKYSAEKENLEKEISGLVDYLTSPGMPGLKGSLVDSEGFPLPGVDLYQIRQARNRYNILNNDYTSLMHKIEAELHSYFGNPETQSSNPRSHEPISLEIGLNDSPIPFAEIIEVTPGSPAQVGGLRIHDKVVGFGSINYTNHSFLSTLASFVRENEGKQIRVSLLRDADNALVTLQVTPQRWDGTGILGCRFRPLN